MSALRENLPVIENDSRWLRLYEKKLERELVDCFIYFRSRGFEPLTIKGWAAARNYPPGTPRFYSDLDLAFSTDDFNRAILLPNSDPDFRFAVDFHCELRQLDSRPWEDIFAGSHLVDLDGYPIRVPSPEDHLRILATHWLNDGGENKQRLWDIAYAVRNRPANFDWQACLGGVGPNRRNWVIITIGAAHRFLGLEIDDLPFAAEAQNLPRWLVSTLEREWRSETPQLPLWRVVNQPREFARQLKKRFPPNPIQATIEMEGELRSRKRAIYQLATATRRVLPSIRHLGSRILRSGE